MLEKINLSVHQLVDFLLRKGDIDDRLFNNKTMEEGSEIHRKFQKKQKANYFSEVDLKTTIVFENYEINLHVNSVERKLMRLMADYVKMGNYAEREFPSRFLVKI